MKRVLSLGVVSLLSMTVYACGSDDDDGGGGGSGATGGGGTDGGAATGGTGATGATGGSGGSGAIGATGGTGAIGATGGTGGAACTDLCTPSGATQCDGDTVETCQTAANGCLDWATTTDCAAQNQVCTVNGGSAACAPACTDMCTTESATQCNGSVVETCTKGSDGCLDWVAGTDCSTTNQACDATGGTAQCVNTCTDQCTPSGTTQCDGATIETCQTGSSGCLEWVTTTDCSATNQTCDSTGTPACVSVCSNKCTAIGVQSCNGNVIQECQADSQNCLDWVATTDCSTTGDTCVQSGNAASCVAPNTGGENCAGAIAVTAGTNIINWTATTNDYLTTKPSCVAVGVIEGPDVVLSYTSAIQGSIDFSLIEKPVDTRWVAVVSDAACGTVTPQLECASDWAPTVINGSVQVDPGKTYYFYVADTSSGTAPLSNPFKLTITENDCAPLPAAVASNPMPANGSTTTTLSPTLTVDFDKPVNETVGVITITGDKGTTISLDLALNPSAVSFNTAGTTMTISTSALQPGENLTVSWSGLKDLDCGKAIAPPTWAFSTPVPPCSPGAGGVVGTMMTQYASGVSTLTEYYVEPDDSPSGYVYIGGTGELYRMLKSGGPLQDVEAAAALTTTNLGYTMAAAGNEVFTVESKTTGTTGHVFRITTDGGATWNVEDYASFPMVPNDDFRSARIYKGKLYLVTQEATASNGTEIWSVPVGATTLPATATLEVTVPNEAYCGGIGVDDNYYYLGCGTNDRLIRVNRATNAVDLITTSIDFNTTNNYVQAADINNDGTADVLYARGFYERLYYVCSPASATPFTDIMLTYDTGASGAYGLGFDALANVLWVYEDTADNLIKIQ